MTLTKTDRVFVAGHRGMVGSAILRRLEGEGYENLITRSHAELDLTRQADVEAFFQAEKPDVVVMAAAHVGGIFANDTYPADFILTNLEMQTHVIASAWRAGAKKFVFLGSACIYPREADQPMTEDALLTGPLEPTNEAYAVAKIAGIKLCQALRRQHGFDAICLMPNNLYGPGDNFHLDGSHVLPALIRKFTEAKERAEPEVVIWGSGAPRREFLHVDDLADAAVFLMENYSAEEIINIGSGEDIAIRDLARLVMEAVGFEGRIGYDDSKPDGVTRKLLDSSRIRAMGWRPKISLEEGIRTTCAWFLENRASARQ